jgi:dTMP kinase
MNKGKLISFEGIDGSGKTTQAHRFVSYLQDKLQKEVLLVRTPGGIPACEKIRSIVLDEDVDSLTRLYLFTASQIEICKKKVIPALESGQYVVMDRYADSTYAYQAVASGLYKDALKCITSMMDLVKPDYTCYMDVSVDVAMNRLKLRDGDNLSIFEKPAFLEKVRVGYQSTLRSDPARFRSFDATLDIDELSKRLQHFADTEVLYKKVGE